MRWLPRPVCPVILVSLVLIGAQARGNAVVLIENGRAKVAIHAPAEVVNAPDVKKQAKIWILSPPAVNRGVTSCPIAPSAARPRAWRGRLPAGPAGP